jgi:serine/threonine protein kinase
LTQLCVGARARLEPFADELPPPSVVVERPLSVAVSRVLSGNEPVLDADAVNGWIRDLARRVPRGIAKVVATCVDRLLEIPLDRSSVEVAPLTVAETKLPAWLPPHRTLGGFYVVRPLGAGAVGSVFVVLRLEDRYDPAAERFALKVPDYSASVARALSEAQFLQMFRDEASALMAVPQHRSLARFVTFDLAARPKPILVMELVEGTMLERMIESGTFDTAKAFKVLDDVLAGLEAMHGVGVGHLDLKPSNVVLRSDDEAVLVDFGLAGRKVRPGCASGPYGAPEVWGVVTGDTAPSPMAVDVYAFGCLAFETLTGRVLFDAESETEQISRHIAHDGLPPMLRGLGENKKLSPMVETLFATLRRDPRNRPSVTRLRDDLRRLAPSLKNLPWPLGAAS